MFRGFDAFLFLLVVLLATATGTVAGSDRASALSDSAYTEVLIEAGDTLWDLARTYGPAGEDTREVVYTICTLNEIDADEIQPGQTILIPNS